MKFTSKIRVYRVECDSPKWNDKHIFFFTPDMNKNRKDMFPRATAPAVGAPVLFHITNGNAVADCWFMHPRSAVVAIYGMVFVDTGKVL